MCVFCLRKSNRFCDFFYAFLVHVVLPKWDLLFWESICSQRSNFNNLRVDPSWQGMQNWKGTFWPKSILAYPNTICKRQNKMCTGVLQYPNYHLRSSRIYNCIVSSKNDIHVSTPCICIYLLNVTVSLRMTTYWTFL